MEAKGDQADPRSALAAIAEAQGESLAALSRLIGRNPAYLQQYVMRGSPRLLAEADRHRLAAYLGVDEAVLGAPEPRAALPAMIPISRIDVEASAGPGGLIEEDRVTGADWIDPALLRRWHVRAEDASIVRARGDSMLPTIADGDEMLIDRGDRRLAERAAIYVIRLDGALMVKRVLIQAGKVAIISDNPAFAPIHADTVDIIGRVIRLSRLFR